MVEYAKQTRFASHSILSVICDDFDSGKCPRTDGWSHGG